MTNDRRRGTVGAVMLLVASAIWGTAFVAQSVAMDRIPPLAFSAARSFVGAAFIIPVIFLLDFLSSRQRGDTYRPSFTFTKTEILGGMACGAFLFVAMNLQQVGLLYTTPGKAGFLTALYIVFVPIINIFFGKRPSVMLTVGVLLSLVGVYLLSVTEDFTIGLGDILVILCGVAYAFQILCVDHFTVKTRGVRLSFVQFLTAGVFSLIFSAFSERVSFSNIIDAILPILYVGILSSGVAYTLQILGQARVPSAIAALFMSLESVFAVLGSMIVLSARPTLREAVGCMLLFGAVLVAQIPSRSKRPSQPAVAKDEN